MKSERVVLAKMDETVNRFVEIAKTVEGQDQSSLTEETRIGIGSHFSFVMALAWVLDMEEEMRELTTKINIVANLAKLQK